ncbi:hypothetical protein B5S28_g2953 [[Candida] boidinii]|nr:hypothetical protein B5S28_g2953 [[Candida] boidinii]
MSEEFTPGTVVLTKLKGFPAWPSMVMSFELLPEKIQKMQTKAVKTLKSNKKYSTKSDKDFVCVRFFGDDDYLWTCTSEMSVLTKSAIDDYLKKKGTPASKSRSKKSSITTAYLLSSQVKSLEDFADFGSYGPTFEEMEFRNRNSNSSNGEIEILEIDDDSDNNADIEDAEEITVSTKRKAPARKSTKTTKTTKETKETKTPKTTKTTKATKATKATSKTTKGSTTTKTTTKRKADTAATKSTSKKAKVATKTGSKVSKKDSKTESKKASKASTKTATEKDIEVIVLDSDWGLDEDENGEDASVGNANNVAEIMESIETNAKLFKEIREIFQTNLLPKKLEISENSENPENPEKSSEQNPGTKTDDSEKEKEKDKETTSTVPYENMDTKSIQKVEKLASKLNHLLEVQLSILKASNLHKVLYDILKDPELKDDPKFRKYRKEIGNFIEKWCGFTVEVDEHWSKNYTEPSDKLEVETNGKTTEAVKA